MKYFEVKAKCGHVGRYNYIIKSFYTCAEDGKEAAFNVRNAPRVKHDQKDAIRFVKEITYQQYLDGLKEHEEDMYFHAKNAQQQKQMCVFEADEIQRENEKVNYTKKQDHHKQRLIEKIFIREWKSEGGLIYE